MNRYAVSALAFAIAGLAVPTGTLTAQDMSPELAERLTDAQRRTYEIFRKARAQFEAKLEAYWAAVNDRREARKRKKALGERFTPEDYVAEHPPKYLGPQLPADIAKILEQLKPPTPERELPTINDFLANAKAHFGFIPMRTSEQDFKRKYAREALAAGLTKDQVVRIYALETGGQGTHDMQAGIDSVSKQGKPISSALGYAQLLNANSINELVKHGKTFARRLRAMAASPDVSEPRAVALQTKANVLGSMLVSAQSVPNEWNEHVKFGTTTKGLGIHALNLDADVGPWLQVLKLKGLKEAAAEVGRTSLSGAEIELMNLAGPRTGLEMMEPVANPMPTANFFSQAGYYRNSIVRELTAAELLKALDARIEINMKKPGAVEFAQIFDEILRQATARP